MNHGCDVEPARMGGSMSLPWFDAQFLRVGHRQAGREARCASAPSARPGRCSRQVLPSEGAAERLETVPQAAHRVRREGATRRLTAEVGADLLPERREDHLDLAEGAGSG